jgi:hypothetical protein
MGMGNEDLSKEEARDSLIASQEYHVIQDDLTRWPETERHPQDLDLTESERMGTVMQDCGLFFHTDLQRFLPLSGVIQG